MKGLSTALAVTMMAGIFGMRDSTTDVALMMQYTLLRPGVVVAPEMEETDDSELEIVDEGVASFYGSQFAGRRTANGEVFDPNAMTAAHPSLPFGSELRVTNAHNGESVVVRVNDRGPFTGGRVIDLSKAAAQEIGMIRSGTAPVVVELID
jgi:rare lipoprotein A